MCDAVSKLPEIFLVGKLLEVVDSFIYNRGYVQNDGNFDQEIDLQNQRTAKAFCDLESRVLCQLHINNNTMLALYK